MIPDYSILSSYLNNYEKQINAIFSPKITLPFQTKKVVVKANLAIKKEPKHKYFICFINRSGSTLLSQVLTRTNKMGRVGEMFNPEPITNISEKNDLTSMSEYIDWQIQTTSQSSDVFGTKIGIHQLAYLAKHGYLTEKFSDAKFIYVTRQDLVMQAISLYIASNTGAWTSRAKTVEKEVEFDYEEIATRLKVITTTQAEFEAFFASHGIKPLRITYEEIEENLTKSMRRACKFVGIERPGQIPLPEIILEKQRTEQSEEWAERFRNIYVKRRTTQQESNDIPQQVVTESTETSVNLIEKDADNAWLKHFKENYIKNTPSQEVNEASTETELPQELNPIQQALRQKNVEQLEKLLRELNATGDQNLITHPKVAIAKRWLSARAIAMDNIELAREMYQPFSMNMPLNQALVLPELTEADLSRAIKSVPDWIELTLILGYLQWKKGSFAESAKTLVSIVKKVGDDALYHTATELYCDSLTRIGGVFGLPSVKDVCLPLINSEQKYRYPFVYLGSVFFKDRPTKNLLTNGKLQKALQLFTKDRSTQQTQTDDNFEKSLELFAKAATRPQGLVPLSGGCLSVINPNQIALLSDAGAKQFNSEVIFDSQNNYQGNGQTVLFFACDSVYFREYAFLLIASVAHLNTQAICHAHIVNPENDTPETILKIRQQFPQITFNVSIEYYDLPQKIPYYASARFIRASQLLDLYQTDLFIVDTDLVVEVSTDDIMKITKDADIGFLVRDGSAPFPWTEVQAGVSYFSNSPNSRRFLTLLQNVILSKLLENNTQSIWYIDQNALFSVYWLMRNELSICNFLDYQKPLFSCYTRTMGRREFTKIKLAQFGIENNL